jgi:hypothetical protein
MNWPAREYRNAPDSGVAAGYRVKSHQLKPNFAELFAHKNESIGPLLKKKP